MLEISPLAAFLAGLLGGAHCVGMCGGIVAAMSLHSDAARRLPLYLGYNLGRLGSYTVAGFIAGSIGSLAFLSERLLPLQTGLFLLAHMMLILLGFYLAGATQAVRWIERAGGALWQRLQPRLTRLLPVRNLRGALLAGALWGWLPCGLVYSVLVMALASGSGAEGALLLFVFGLGTLPNLLAMGWMAERLRKLARNVWLKRGAGAAVAAFGLWGIAHWALVRA